MSIMLPPDSQGNNQAPGWRANDLWPGDVDILAENFRMYCVPRDPDACWPWAGQRNRDGYGVVPGRNRQGVNGLLAHRVAWVLASQTALTVGVSIDHLCRNKLCVNPRHLEPVPIAENLRRLLEFQGRLRPDKTDPDPTAMHRKKEFADDGHGRRICPVCETAFHRSYVAQHLARVHPEAA